jgi:Domain of unknown function (DUF6249)
MKTFFVICLCSIALPVGLWAQSPPPPSAPPSASATVSPAGSPESELEKSIRKKHGKHFNFTIDDHDVASGDTKDRHHGNDDIPEFVIPIVALGVLGVFGAPVVMVALIMYFGFSRNRMMHRTIRMMVEKGQPVPAALLAPPPPAIRQRSDMRRGVVLATVGIGLMLFLGAVNEWDNGAWATGLIPFFIGAGYLLVWKLEGGNKPKTDNSPPLP